MRDFVIMTDSCCDLTDEMARDRRGGGAAEFADGRSDLPQLAGRSGHRLQGLLQPHPGRRDRHHLRRQRGGFQEQMREILSQGKDVLYLSFSSALSTTYQSAVIAADDLERSFPTGRCWWWTPGAPLWARACWCICAPGKRPRAGLSPGCGTMRRPPRAISATGSLWTI